jgi:hypothetical protein
MVQLVREPVMIGLAVSGLLAIVVRVLETTVLRTPAGLSWPAWDLLVPSAGVLAGLASFFYRRLRTEQRRAFGSMSGAMLLGAFGALTMTGAVLIAFAREDVALSPDATDDTPAAGSSAKVNADTTADPDDGTPRATPTSSPRVLAGRTQAAYDVWKELYEHIRRRRLKSALESLEKLVQLDPTALEDKDVRDAVLELTVQAFYQDNEHSDRMARLATEKLGTWGPDLLFEIMVTRGATEADRQAQLLLGDEAIRARGSEGMRLAYFIRTSKGCEEKKARILNAKKDGDHRVLREINILQRCGRRHPCCLRDDREVDAVAAAIKARQ